MTDALTAPLAEQPTITRSQMSEILGDALDEQAGALLRRDRSLKLRATRDALDACNRARSLADARKRIEQLEALIEQGGKQ